MATAAWRLGHAKESVRIAELVYGQLARKDPAAAGMKAAEVALARRESPTAGRRHVNLGRALTQLPAMRDWTAAAAAETEVISYFPA